MVDAALLSAFLLWAFDSIVLLYLIVALGNLLILVYLCKRETTIWPDLKSFISGHRL